MNYELKLEQFSGPIEKLLELIEGKKMEITELNLADVTADFLRYIKQIDADLTQSNGNALNAREYARLLADFAVIASRLLLIKSKALLPNLCLTEEEEESIKDLENRLKNYQQFKQAINYIKNLSEQNKVSISRPLFIGRPVIFYPPENFKVDDLCKAMKQIFESIEQFQHESKVVKLPLITLEEKIEEIMAWLNADFCGTNADLRGQINFTKLTKKKICSEIIVLFLALLHLLSRQSIRIEQKERFSDIIVMK